MTTKKAAAADRKLANDCVVGDCVRIAATVLAGEAQSKGLLVVCSLFTMFVVAGQKTACIDAFPEGKVRTTVHDIKKKVFRFVANKEHRAEIFLLIAQKILSRELARRSKS